MLRIDDLSDAEFMKLQAEYGDSLPLCPICTLEDVRHLLLELIAGDAVSDEVKNALAPVLYAVTGARWWRTARWRSRETALRISVAMRITMTTRPLHGRSRIVNFVAWFRRRSAIQCGFAVSNSTDFDSLDSEPVVQHRIAGGFDRHLLAIGAVSRRAQRYSHLSHPKRHAPPCDRRAHQRHHPRDSQQHELAD